MGTSHRGVRADRDLFIDFLRVASLAMVIAMHWLSTHVWVDNGLHSVIALNGWPIMAVSWVLQPMTVLFFTGGVANTLVLRRAETRYAPFVASRTYGIGVPVLALLAVWIPVIALLSILMPGAAGVTATSLTKPLWFLVVYPPLIAIAPLMLRAHEHRPWLTLGGLAAASFLVDAAGDVGHGPWQWANMVFVWAFCHQLGIMYADGTFTTTPLWVKACAALISAGGIGLLTMMGPYPPAAVGTATYPLSNLVPPTGALVLLAVAQVMAISAVAPTAKATFARVNPGVLGAANKAAMGAYLWHLPVLMALIGIAMVRPSVLLPADRGEFWAARPWWVLAGIALLVPALMFASWWNRTMPRRQPVRGVARSALAAVTLATGIAVIWRVGIGIDVWQLAGAAVIVAGCGLSGLPLLPRSHRATAVSTAAQPPNNRTGRVQ